MPAAGRPSGASARPEGPASHGLHLQHPRADVPHEVNHLPGMAAVGPGLAAIFVNSGTLALPTAGRPSGTAGSASLAGDALRRPWHSPAASPGRCPVRGEPFARDGRCGTRLSGHLRQFGNPCHADGGAPVRRIGPPGRPGSVCARPRGRPVRKARPGPPGRVPDGSCLLPGTRSGQGCATLRFPLWRTSHKSGTRPRSIKVRRS